jgi:hypothetical protein
MDEQLDRIDSKNSGYAWMNRIKINDHHRVIRPFWELTMRSYFLAVPNWNPGVYWNDRH